MIRHALDGVLVVGLAAAAVTAGQARPQDQSQAPPATASLTAAIGRLGAFDLDTRTAAARLVRRTPREIAVPALTQAARSNADEYVRYRALVLLSGFGPDAASGTMRALMTDRDDRLRTVAFQWFEHHPDPAVLPALVEALDREQSEFVRPALTRAIAAYGNDPRASAVLLPLVARGEDLFRGAVIDALGDYHDTYALQAIAAVATLDGPLQDDAVTAIGQIGDPSMLSLLAKVQSSASPDLQPAIAASVCLLSTGCAPQEDYLRKTLAFAAGSDTHESVLEASANALGVLAVAGKTDALDALVDVGAPSSDPVRGVIATAVGSIAMRNAAVVLDVFAKRSDRDAAIRLLRDGFDELSEEDFEQERFCTAVRQAYASAPAGSARHDLAAALIDALQF
jgi:HEAT repeat protein